MLAVIPRYKICAGWNSKGMKDIQKNCRGNHPMRKQYQRFAKLLSLAIVAVQSVALYTQAVLPDHYYVAAGETLNIRSSLPITTRSSQGSLPAEAQQL